MSNKSYYELLLERGWLLRRDPVLLRDEYRCVKCQSSENLHVHHQQYIRDRSPWEYRDCDLITLCASCHSHLHERNNLRQEIERRRLLEGSTGRPIAITEVIAKVIG